MHNNFRSNRQVIASHFKLDVYGTELFQMSPCDGEKFEMNGKVLPFHEIGLQELAQISLRGFHNKYKTNFYCSISLPINQLLRRENNESAPDFDSLPTEITPQKFRALKLIDCKRNEALKM